MKTYVGSSAFNFLTMFLNVGWAIFKYLCMFFSRKIVFLLKTDGNPALQTSNGVSLKMFKALLVFLHAVSYNNDDGQETRVQWKAGNGSSRSCQSID